MNIAVVYLAYIPYGIKPFQIFFESYAKQVSSANHELIIIFKGLKTNNEANSYLALLSSLNIQVNKVFHHNTGLDIASYNYAAKKLTSEYILFFNTNSILLTPDCINCYSRSLGHSDIGLISATASNQSLYSSAFQKNKYFFENRKGFFYYFREYKLLIKVLLYWRFLFKPFPNPHARTNAFLVRRKLFLELNYKLPTTKLKAYQIESGINSLTNQILKKGYKVLVVGKNGTLYEPSQWKDSNTFWSGNQENLLVSDNQTRVYNDASFEGKKQLSKLAWGGNKNE